VQARLEVGDVARVLAQQILPELLAPVHLHRQPPEIAQQLLACLQDLAALAPQRTGRARTPNRAWGRRSVGRFRLAALSPKASRQWKSRHGRRL
jgi:hypothetical protein